MIVLSLCTFLFSAERDGRVWSISPLAKYVTNTVILQHKKYALGREVGQIEDLRTLSYFLHRFHDGFKQCEVLRDCEQSVCTAVSKQLPHIIDQSVQRLCTNPDYVGWLPSVPRDSPLEMYTLSFSHMLACNGMLDGLNPSEKLMFKRFGFNVGQARKAIRKQCEQQLAHSIEKNFAFTWHVPIKGVNSMARQWHLFNYLQDPRVIMKDAI
jgi:hypothetical protein